MSFEYCIFVSKQIFMDRKSFLQRVLSVFSGIVLSQNILSAENTKRQDILLLQTNIAGYQYYNGKKVEKYFNKGDLLKLKLQEDNPYDSNAVEIYFQDVKIGYLPRYDNEVIANLLREEKQIYAKIDEFMPHNPDWNKVSVAVYMG